MTHDSLESLLSWWSGSQFAVGHFSPAAFPRAFLARDRRRIVVALLGENYRQGDNLRLKTGAFVELGRHVGSTKELQAWTVKS